MVTAKRLHKNGANITVVASSEVLGAPGGDVDLFLRKVSNTVRRRVSDSAPKNKRPRWRHYGEPLKRTIEINDTRFQKAKKGFRLYSAVGSSSHYAYYVDQGTRDFMAKLLPPWEAKGYQFHEASWKPGFPFINSEPVGQIPVRGQKPQFYFERGLREALLRVHLATREGSDAEPKIAAASRVTPYGLDNFKGNTPWSIPFEIQREEWRKAREIWWHNRSAFRRKAQTIGKKYGRRQRNRKRKSAEDRRKAAAQASKRYRDSRTPLQKLDALEAQRYRRGQVSWEQYVYDQKIEREQRARERMTARQREKAAEARKRAETPTEKVRKRKPAMTADDRSKRLEKRKRKRVKALAERRVEQITSHGGSARVKAIRDSFGAVLGYNVVITLPSGEKHREPFYI